MILYDLEEIEGEFVVRLSEGEDSPLKRVYLDLELNFKDVESQDDDGDWHKDELEQDVINVVVALVQSHKNFLSSNWKNEIEVTLTENKK